MKSSFEHVVGLCSTGHGAAAALVSKQHGIRATTLERFTGVKHSLLFTRRELDEILARASPIDRGIYDALTFSFDRFPPAYTVERTLVPFVRHLLQDLPIGPADIDLVVTTDSYFAFNWGRVGNTLRSLFPGAELHTELEHHEVHRWQAFLPSPFSEAAVLTADESGEPLARLDGGRLAMTLGHARGPCIEVLEEHRHPHSSPGRLFGAFSRYLAFFAGEEGKTMGLAPYGRDTLYEALRPALHLHDDGSFDFLDEDELSRWLSDRVARRRPGQPLEPVHADVAYAGQRILEDVMVHAARVLADRLPGVTDLCVAGGVGLNSCANERMLRGSPFERIYIAPNAGDNGQALACASYGAYVLGGLPRRENTHDYLGPPRSDREVEVALARHGLTSVPTTAAEVAALLAEGYILAVHQGAAEYGPRALGNRTILADPRRSEMTDRVNAHVKHRELFRPYAPIVLDSRANELFECDQPSPFMLRVVAVRPEHRDSLAAITHVDGTARVQTLTRETNPWVYAILEAFDAITGVPALMNTSFNLAGKPIVETADDAVECFLATGLDGLLFGHRLVLKEEPPSRRPYQPPADQDSYQRLLAEAPCPS